MREKAEWNVEKTVYTFHGLGRLRDGHVELGQVELGGRLAQVLHRRIDERLAVVLIK